VGEKATSHSGAYIESSFGAIQSEVKQGCDCSPLSQFECLCALGRARLPCLSTRGEHTPTCLLLRYIS
jgi:hypothetical protein